MQSPTVEEPLRGIGFIGNYLPRKCGIATFTYDLAEAVCHKVGVDTRVIVAVVNDRPEGYAYPSRVQFQIEENKRGDYKQAAGWLNDAGVDVVSLQHEYGIFGDRAGANVLALMRRLKKPVVVTCHTVLEHPSADQRGVLMDIVSRATRVVAMSHHSAALLKSVYDAEVGKVVVIRHGVHPYPFVDPNSCKAKLGLGGRKVILTFGLLGPEKGIDDMIVALSKVVRHDPRAIYVILGATHPRVLADEGEAYREELQVLTRRLGLEDNIVFDPRFVDLAELLEYISAADICVTPYKSMDHISSGALSYAMATGKAVISTPFTYALEALADGRGRLVPSGDTEALAREVLTILGNERATTVMRKRAFEWCRGMGWPAVAADYVRLFMEVRAEAVESRGIASVTAGAATRAGDARRPIQR